MFNKNSKDAIFFRNVRQPGRGVFSLFRPNRIKATRTVVAVIGSSILPGIYLGKSAFIRPEEPNFNAKGREREMSSWGRGNEPTRWVV